MIYKVSIATHAVNQIVQIDNYLGNTKIGHNIIHVLRNLNVFPWSFPSAAKKYDSSLPYNVRVVPLKHHYIGIYYIEKHAVKVTNIESQYEDIKSLLQKLKFEFK